MKDLDLDVATDEFLIAHFSRITGASFHPPIYAILCLCSGNKKLKRGVLMLHNSKQVASVNVFLIWTHDV